MGFPIKMDDDSLFAEIEGFPGYYVTAKGNVYSAKKKNGLKKLKPVPHNNGYLRLKLVAADGSHCDRYIHRLVASAFLPKPKQGMEVNHKNGTKTDNRIENLEWVTRKSNIVHMFNVLKKGTLSLFNLYYKNYFIGCFKGIKTCAWFANVNAESLHVHHKVGNWRIERVGKEKTT